MSANDPKRTSLRTLLKQKAPVGTVSEPSAPGPRRAFLPLDFSVAYSYLALYRPRPLWGDGGHFEIGAVLGDKSWPSVYFQIAASNKLKFVHIGRTRCDISSALAGKINLLESA